MITLEEGDNCPDTDCSGVLEYLLDEDCTCHINSPCSACESVLLTCNECGQEIED